MVVAVLGCGSDDQGRAVGCIWGVLPSSRFALLLWGDPESCRWGCCVCQHQHGDDPRQSLLHLAGHDALLPTAGIFAECTACVAPTHFFLCHAMLCHAMPSHPTPPHGSRPDPLSHFSGMASLEAVLCQGQPKTRGITSDGMSRKYLWLVEVPVRLCQVAELGLALCGVCLQPHGAS